MSLFFVFYIIVIEMRSIDSYVTDVCGALVCILFRASRGGVNHVARHKVRTPRQRVCAKKVDIHNVRVA